MTSSADYLQAHAAEFFHCAALRAMIRKAHCKQLLARPTMDQIPVDFLGILGPIVRPPACGLCPMGLKFHHGAARPQIKHNSSGGSVDEHAAGASALLHQSAQVRKDVGTNRVRSRNREPDCSPAPQKQNAPVSGGTGDRVPDLRGPIPSLGSGVAGDAPPPTPRITGGSSNQDTGCDPGNRGSSPRPPTNLPFSTRLQLARKNADLKQSELEYILNIPQSHISAAEHGRQLNRTYTNKLRAWVARQEGK